MDFIFDPSLVLYVPLEQLDGSSFTSKDAYSHLCSVTGAALEPGRGRYFDGTDDLIYCGTGESLRITGKLTIEAWVNFASGQSNNCLIAKQAASPNICYALILFNNGKVRFHVHDGSSFYVAITSAAPSADTWHHLLGIYDRANVKVYVDMVETIGDAFTGAVNDVAAVQVSLGDYSSYDGTYALDGIIGEARIYNRALTFPEIQHNYLATKWRYR